MLGFPLKYTHQVFLFIIFFINYWGRRAASVTVGNDNFSAVGKVINRGAKFQLGSSWHN